MLSILIPVYNFEINKLVDDLLSQAIDAQIVFEILCFDDGSTAYFKNKNKRLNELKYVNYVELPENLGRSKIRNELAKAAKYEYLLFMDCDSKVVSTDYILKYIKYLKPDTLLYGGRIYDQMPPSDPQLKLHWHYGIQREQVDYKIRQKQPYHAFQTNNFLVPKKVFSGIWFEEHLKQYGHEDTLFGFELKNRQIPLLHIDNPLEHIGLESADVFLSKTEKGIQNLIKLSQEYSFVSTKLLRAYQWSMSTGLKYPVKWIFRIFKKKMEQNLRSDRLSLRCFDFYKLGMMVENGGKREKGKKG